ncbi:O-antigen ligase family protein [Aeromicrobium wangtongii]|uniref:O-antigen ligase family protein n=1 Tax=Aeromicrobium wangtongii TaxID=2969247 RepID=UPI0020173DF9|nr:O-antigen ligase family protein [Aeromicrobium wangtongii]MCL3817850.1 O-antigen ligase family protein [Aeromicrobium wangtongii]
MAAPALERRLPVGHRPRADGVTVLTVYLVALTCIPSRLVFGPLGGAGAPAGVLGLGCLTWWAWSRVQRNEPDTDGFQPVRWAFILMAFAFSASFIAAMTRPISGEEFSGAQLGMVLMAGWGGVLLVAHDGIPTRERLYVLLRRVVAIGGVIAALGIAQFVTGRSLVDAISIPGLSANHTLFGLTQREGFTRPSGMATHPIEYGAVITMILPLALALAFGDRNRSALRRWFPVVVLAASVPLSISRSALLSAVVGSVVILVSWPPAARRIAAAAAAVMVVGVYVTVPGMLGSLLGLFTSIGGDSSALSRTGSYPIAFEFVQKSPLFGRGFSTFLPKYRILDNQFLGLLIEVGIIGLVAFVALIVTALVCVLRAGKRYDDRLARQASQGLAAAVAAGAASFAVFDGLSFPMSAGLFFLMLGLAGASVRLTRREGVPDGAGSSTPV